MFEKFASLMISLKKCSNKHFLNNLLIKVRYTANIVRLSAG